MNLPKFSLEGIEGNTKIALNGVLKYLQDKDDFINKLYGKTKDINFTTDGTLANNSDNNFPSEKAIVTYTTRQIFIVSEQQPANTSGGTFTSGADRQRVLNTIVLNTISGASLGSNNITLPIGLYKIMASCPANACDTNIAWLYNLGLTTKVVLGTSQHSAQTNNVEERSIINGYFTVTDTSANKNVFQILHRCTTTKSTDGFGLAANLGTNETYTICEIEKIG
ncbi:MAG: hypothetical protein HGB12_00250 [Bacteroidetes bacterium]|nr:hypothetical protein [Bacteroidota bacterium]